MVTSISKGQRFYSWSLGRDAVSSWLVSDHRWKREGPAVGQRCGIYNRCLPPSSSHVIANIMDQSKQLFPWSLGGLKIKVCVYVTDTFRSCAAHTSVPTPGSLVQNHLRSGSEQPTPQSELAREIWATCPPGLKASTGFLRYLCLHACWVALVAACQAPLSMGFSRQEYWSRLPFPSPGDLPNPSIELESLMSPSPPLASRFFSTSARWEA